MGTAQVHNDTIVSAIASFVYHVVLIVIFLRSVSSSLFQIQSLQACSPLIGNGGSFEILFIL